MDNIREVEDIQPIFRVSPFLVEPGAKGGEYPLFATIAARNIRSSEWVFNIKVGTPGSHKM